MKRHSNIPAAMALAMAAAAFAGQIDQTVTLVPGWNAVYVSVAPKMSATDVFNGWPVWSVSAYNAQTFLSSGSTAGGKTGEGTMRAPYWIWSRESPEASSMQRLQADSVLVCFSTNTADFTATLRGVPAAPRIAWHVSNDQNKAPRNVVGVRLAGQVKARDWFAGCPALPEAESQFCYISGPDDASPRIRPIATGNKTAYLNDGDVVFVSGSEVSDWSGPLYIMPRAGIDFGEKGTLDELSIRNDGVEAKTVGIEYIPSSDGMTRPQLLYRESGGETVSDDWQALDNALSRRIGTGETWRVTLALDRSKLAGTGAELGGVLRIVETGGTQVRSWLPVSAKDVKPAAPWPQGLWETKLALSKVSFYADDSNRVDGVSAGGRMGLKIYLHLDSAGKARLLQRVTVAGYRSSEGSVVENLYGPNATVPPGMDYATRLSSATLPVDMPATESTSGTFGATDFPLVFNYTIGATSPSNPFRHALHPLFDNKQMDFKTPAPDGDDFSNYVGSVKPELFSIGGEVQLLFDESSATAWTPMENLSGTCKWIYTGVRRDGPIVAEGNFTMQRIATNGNLE